MDLTAADIFPSARAKPARTLFDRLAGGGYACTWLDASVRIEVRYLRRAFSQLHGEVDVLCDWAGARTHEGSLSCADLNLSNQTARLGLAKFVEQRAKTNAEDFDWVGVVDEACRRVIQAERAGSDGIVLDDAPDEGPPQDFVVHGLSIPSDSHSMLVCDGGGLKSFLLLLVTGAMAKAGTPVGYFDWEWNAPRHKARKVRLFGPERLEHLHYKRCYAPLTAMGDELRRFVDQHQLRFIAIDSVGAAVDGKLNDDDVARAYNRALDQLPPSLAAAHIPKGKDADPGKPFGSAFFYNFARMTWTVKKQDGPEAGQVTVMLTPGKQNDGAPQPVVGLTFTFAETSIRLCRADLTKVAALVDGLPLHGRIANVLKGGARTVEDIASTLTAKPNSVTQSLRRGRGNLFLVTAGADGVERWGVLERRSVDP